MKTKYRKTLTEGEEFNPYQQFNGIFIPEGLVKCQQIKDSVKILMGRLFRYAGENGKAYPYRITLAHECGWEIRKLDRTIKHAKDLKLIKTFPYKLKNKKVENSPNTYVFLYNKVYDTGKIPLVKNDSAPLVKNDSAPLVKNDKHKRVRGKRVSGKKLSKDSLGVSGETLKKGGKVWNKIDSKKKNNPVDSKKKNNPVDSKKKNNPDPTERSCSKKKIPVAKQKINFTTEKNYKWLVDAGATKHNLTKQSGLTTLDSLHSLLSPKSKKSPYHGANNNTTYYSKFSWTIEDLLDAFKFQLKYTKVKPIKNIGEFIFSKFNGNGSYSPLIHWHSAMKKGITGELNDQGALLFKVMKQKGVIDLVKLSANQINEFADMVVNLKETFVLFDGSERNNTYRTGILAVVAEYIKEKQNRTDFEWFWITNPKFKEEFLAMTKKRNILKKKPHPNALRFGKVS